MPRATELISSQSPQGRSVITLARLALFTQPSYKGMFPTRGCFHLKSKLIQVEMMNDLPTVRMQTSENTRNWFPAAYWELS